MNALAYVIIFVLAILVVLLVKRVRRMENDIETLFARQRNPPPEQPNADDPYAMTDAASLAVQRHVRDYHS